MDIGAFELQIFIGLVVVLGAAFVALVCDYLKGNNEQLREKNIELRVRKEEQERHALLDPGSVVPQNFLEQFFAAARHAGLILTSNPASQKSEPAVASAEQKETSARKDKSAMDVRSETLGARNTAGSEDLGVQTVTVRGSRGRAAMPRERMAIDQEAGTAPSFVEAPPAVQPMEQELVPARMAAEVPVPMVKAELIAAESNAATTVLNPANKSEKEWVRPEVMARVVLKANRQAVANAMEAAQDNSPERNIEAAHSPAWNEMMSTPQIPVVPVQAAQAAAVSTPALKSNIREEIQRLKQQANTRFEAQFAAESAIEPGKTEVKPTPEEAQTETLVQNVSLENELARVSQIPAPVESGMLEGTEVTNDAISTDAEAISEEKLSRVEALYLQQEIVRVANLQQDENATSVQPPVSILIPEEPVAPLSLASELNRVAAPVPASTDALLDQIIRASAREEAPTPEAVAEPEYLFQEASAFHNNETVMASVPAQPASHVTVESGSLEHDELLYQLLNSSRTEMTDELLPEDSVLLDESTVAVEDVPVVAVQEKEAPKAPLAMPPGVHDMQTLNRFLEMSAPLTGVVICAGINDYTKISLSQNRAQMDEYALSARKLLQSTMKEKDFLARVADDQWLLVFPGELGTAAQRRIDGVAEKFWDYQLRNLGQTPLNFSTGAVQVEGEPLMEAFLAAQERMEDARGGKKSKEAKRKAVNS